MLAPPQRSFLRELLGEMQLCVADAVDDPRDRAALSLALPLHRLQPAKKGCQEVLLMHVGMELFLSRTRLDFQQSSFPLAFFGFKDPWVGRDT